MTDDDKSQIEWDKVLRQTWLNTSLERDKAIITLSSAGLALIIAFIAKASVGGSSIRLPSLLGLIGFTISILSGVRCLHINRRFIERELRREAESGSTVSDKLLIGGFVVGVLSVALIGLATILFP